MAAIWTPGARKKMIFSTQVKVRFLLVAKSTAEPFPSRSWGNMDFHLFNCLTNLGMGEINCCINSSKNVYPVMWVCGGHYDTNNPSRNRGKGYMP